MDNRFSARQSVAFWIWIPTVMCIQVSGFQDLLATDVREKHLPISMHAVVSSLTLNTPIDFCPQINCSFCCFAIVFQSHCQTVSLKLILYNITTGTICIWMIWILHRSSSIIYNIRRTTLWNMIKMYFMWNYSQIKKPEIPKQWCTPTQHVKMLLKTRAQSLVHRAVKSVNHGSHYEF